MITTVTRGNVASHNVQDAEAEEAQDGEVEHADQPAESTAGKQDPKERLAGQRSIQPLYKDLEALVQPHLCNIVSI